MTIVQSDLGTTSVLNLPDDDAISEYIEDSAPMNYVEAIETVISSLAQEDTAMVSHSDSGSLWKFKYGSVEVFVQLTGQTDEDTLTVWSTVLKLPVANEAQLTRKLLEMNGTGTLEARFAILENQVVVLSSRTVADLSAGEISRAVTIVATLSDENDELLQQEFPAA